MCKSGYQDRKHIILDLTAHAMKYKQAKCNMIFKLLFMSLIWLVEAASCLTTPDYTALQLKLTSVTLGHQLLKLILPVWRESGESGRDRVGDGVLTPRFFLLLLRQLEHKSRNSTGCQPEHVKQLRVPLHHKWMQSKLLLKKGHLKVSIEHGVIVRRSTTPWMELLTRTKKTDPTTWFSHLTFRLIDIFF